MTFSQHERLHSGSDATAGFGQPVFQAGKYTALGRIAASSAVAGSFECVDLLLPNISVASADSITARYAITPTGYLALSQPTGCGLTWICLLSTAIQFRYCYVWSQSFKNNRGQPPAPEHQFSDQRRTAAYW